MPVDNDIKDDPELAIHDLHEHEKKAFSKAVWAEFALLALIFAICYPESSIMRAPDGSLTSPQSPVMQGLVPILFLVFSTPGLVYGIASGSFKSTTDVIKAMENVMRMLLSFIVFCFFAAQFLYVFGQSNIGALLAISGAEFLRDSGYAIWYYPLWYYFAHRYA